MSLNLIRAAFDSRLGAWALTQSLPVAWPNAAFTPPDGTYLRAYLLPASTESLDLERKHRGYHGVYQVSIYLKSNVGPEAGDPLVAAIESLFPLNAPMDSGGLSVWVTRPMSAAPPLEDEGRYVIPMSCEYAASTYT